MADRLTAAEAREMVGASGRGRVRLLFLPPSAGYEQNPICVYYVYDENTDGAEGLQRCIAEVTKEANE